MSIIVSAPAEILLGGVSIGTTKGDTIITCNREYEPMKRQDSPHPFGYRKKNISWDIEIPVSEHDTKNLARLFDLSEADFDAMTYTSQALQNLGTLAILAGGEQYTWTKVISIGTNGISYTVEGVTIIPLKLRAILISEDGPDIGDTGAAPSLASLDGNDLPGQFTYKIRKIKRAATVETYGGTQHYSADSIYDIFIEWLCDNMNWVDKTMLETIFDDTGSMTFTGIHGESYTVYFESMEAPEEEDGYWKSSGVLRVKPD